MSAAGSGIVGSALPDLQTRSSLQQTAAVTTVKQLARHTLSGRMTTFPVASRYGWARVRDEDSRLGLGMIDPIVRRVCLRPWETCMSDTILLRTIARNASLAVLSLLMTNCSSTGNSNRETADATCIREQIADLPVGSSNTLEEDAHACHVQVPDLSNDFDLQQRAHVEGLPFLKTTMSSGGTSRYYCHAPVSIWAKAWSPFPSSDGCRLINFTAASG